MSKISNPSNVIVTEVIASGSIDRQRVIHFLEPGEMLYLVQEYIKKQKVKAIKVLRTSGDLIGYLDHKLHDEMNWIYKSTFRLPKAKVLKIINEEMPGDETRIIIEIYPPTPDIVAAISGNLYLPL